MDGMPLRTLACLVLAALLPATTLPGLIAASPQRPSSAVAALLGVQVWGVSRSCSLRGGGAQPALAAGLGLQVAVAGMGHAVDGRDLTHTQNHAVMPS